MESDVFQLFNVSLPMIWNVLPNAIDHRSTCWILCALCALMTDNVVNDLFSYFHRIIANTFSPPPSGVFCSYLLASVFPLKSPRCHLVFWLRPISVFLNNSIFPHPPLICWKLEDPYGYYRFIESSLLWLLSRSGIERQNPVEEGPGEVPSDPPETLQRILQRWDEKTIPVIFWCMVSC